VLVADDGIGMAPRSDSPGMGLGLPLIARLADSLQVRQSHEGTQLLVSFRPSVSPPAPA
jgi:serine/threonine-protein kinase RsbW